MLSKLEKNKLNSSFWNSFGDYMSKTRSSVGYRINWLNYPSGVKSIFIRLEVNSKGASLCFDIQSKDAGIRAILWEQMTELKAVMEDQTGEAEWLETFYLTGGQEISRIRWQHLSLNLYKTEDHTAIFDYLKDRLIRFDNFYQEYKEIMVLLAK
jgi:hypothetical protein